MGIKYATHTKEEQEDMGLLKAMNAGKTARRTVGKHVSIESVMKILKG